MEVSVKSNNIVSFDFVFYVYILYMYNIIIVRIINKGIDS